MLNAIIATRESERTLVPTLSALVPAVTDGLLAEVVVADAGSRDATADMADIAGCRLMASSGPLGARLKAAAASTRAPWLLFLRAGHVPAPGWVAAVGDFIERAGSPAGNLQAAVFRAGAASAPRPGFGEVLAAIKTAFAGAEATRGLLIARSLYDELGGHPPHDGAEAALLRRLGRRRIGLLAAGLTYNT
jgi:glycosyltransferase involved in cell wall biosynthesis